MSSSTRKEKNPITALMKDQKIDDPKDCLPSFHFRANSLCIEEANGNGTLGIFDLQKCNDKKTEQQWVKIVSKYDPEIIQICYFLGHMTCLTSTKETEDGSRFNYVFLTEYHDNALQVLPAQLWKMKTNSNMILNYAKSDSCLRFIPLAYNHKPSSSLGILAITPCEDDVMGLYTNWSFKILVSAKNKNQNCYNLSLSLQSPIQSAAVINRNSKNPFSCQPHFYFKKSPSINACLLLEYSEKKDMFFFDWSVCNMLNPSHKWINVGSKNKPGWIQICHAYHRNKCIKGNNFGNYTSLVYYQQSTVEESHQAQLWKMNSGGQLVNLNSGLCLQQSSGKNKYGVKEMMSLLTTNCEGLQATESLLTKWFFLPIFDRAGHRTCSDFPIV